MYKRDFFEKSINNETGRFEYRLGNILVVEDKKDKFYSIYLSPVSYNKKFISSREKLKPALKLAKLLNITYEEGFVDARDRYDEETWR